MTKAPLHQINVGLGVLHGQPDELNHPSSGQSKPKTSVISNQISNQGNQIVGNFVAYGLHKPNFGSQPVQDRLGGASGRIGPAQTKRTPQADEEEEQTQVFASIFHNEALAGAGFVNRNRRQSNDASNHALKSQSLNISSHLPEQRQRSRSGKKNFKEDVYSPTMENQLQQYRNLSYSQKGMLIKEE